MAVLSWDTGHICAAATGVGDAMRIAFMAAAVGMTAAAVVLNRMQALRLPGATSGAHPADLQE